MVLRLVSPFPDGTGALYSLLLPCSYTLLHDDVTLRLNPQQIWNLIISRYLEARDRSFSQGPLLPVPRERPVGERTWERGWGEIWA